MTLQKLWTDQIALLRRTQAMVPPDHEYQAELSEQIAWYEARLAALTPEEEAEAARERAEQEAEEEAEAAAWDDGDNEEEPSRDDEFEADPDD